MQCQREISWKEIKKGSEYSEALITSLQNFSTWMLRVTQKYTTKILNFIAQNTGYSTEFNISHHLWRLMELKTSRKCSTHLTLLSNCETFRHNSQLKKVYDFKWLSFRILKFPSTPKLPQWTAYDSTHHSHPPIQPLFPTSNEVNPFHFHFPDKIT